MGDLTLLGDEIAAALEPVRKVAPMAGSFHIGQEVALVVNHAIRGSIVSRSRVSREEWCWWVRITVDPTGFYPYVISSRDSNRLTHLIERSD